MVVTTGRSQRHVGSVADNVVKGLQANTRVRVEGMRQADWVLIDAGDVIVHVFRRKCNSTRWKSVVGRQTGRASVELMILRHDENYRCRRRTPEAGPGN